jgi:hypothetical protein
VERCSTPEGKTLLSHFANYIVALLCPKLGEGNPDPSDEEKANRCFHVRAVFAIVEAVVEQHRCLLVHLCEFGKITLPENRLNKLREIKNLDENGAVVGEEANYLRALERSRRSITQQRSVLMSR